MPWESLSSSLEVLVLLGTSVPAPPSLLPATSLMSLLVVTSIGAAWNTLPLLPPSMVYLSMSHLDQLHSGLRLDPLAFFNLPELRLLYLSKQKLDMIPFLSECPLLTNLKVDTNALTALPDLSKHDLLRQLSFYNNLVETMPLLPQSLSYLRWCAPTPIIISAHLFFFFYYHYLQQVSPIKCRIINCHQPHRATTFCTTCTLCRPNHSKKICAP